MIEHSTAFPLGSLVSCPPGGVVSRTLLDSSAGTVTLFAFDSGQGLSEHTAPFDALVFIVEGSAEITINGSAHVLGQGEMILMPAHRPHALRALEPFKMMLVMIRAQGA